MSARKRGLGRGLDALLQPEGSAAPGLRLVPLDRLHPNRRQPRSHFDSEGLAELAESIRVQGIVQPLVVSAQDDGSFTIVAGERRWRAARLAGVDEVPVMVRELSGDHELLEIALVENVQRADLNPLEEAEAYQVLGSHHGLNHEEIARRVGKSRAAISNSLRLLRLTEEVQDMLRDGRLTAGQARPLLALEAEVQVKLARRAVEEGLSARALESLSGKKAKPRRTSKNPAVDPHTRAAAERLTKVLQTRVEIRRRGAGGEIRIGFHSEEELMRLFDRLLG
jgi:ParB family chromosome partitioning protein